MELADLNNEKLGGHPCPAPSHGGGGRCAAGGPPAPTRKPMSGTALRWEG